VTGGTPVLTPAKTEIASSLTLLAMTRGSPNIYEKNNFGKAKLLPEDYIK